jgi:hypothetical protein
VLEEDKDSKRTLKRKRPTYNSVNHHPFHFGKNENKVFVFNSQLPLTSFQDHGCLFHPLPGKEPRNHHTPLPQKKKILTFTATCSTISLALRNCNSSHYMWPFLTWVNDTSYEYGCTYISKTLRLLGLASGDVIILDMVTRVGSNVNQGMPY